MTIIFELPMPPSVNHCFVNNYGKGTRGRHKSKEYTAFSKEAAMLMAMKREFRAVHDEKTKWGIVLNFHFPQAIMWKSDLDNRIKPILDAICDNCNLRDRYLTTLTAYKVATNKSVGFVQGMVTLG